MKDRTSFFCLILVSVEVAKSDVLHKLYMYIYISNCSFGRL